MILPRLAIRNLGRNRRRTALTVTVVALGAGVLFFVTCSVEGAYEEYFDILAKTMSGHIRVVNGKYDKKERLLPVDLTVRRALVDDIERVAGVERVVARTRFGALLYQGEESKEALGLGLDIERERRVLGIDRFVISGGYFSSDTAAEVIVPYLLAEKLGVKMGGELTVMTSTSFGSMSAANLRIVGISRMDMTMYDEVFFFVPHGTAERMLDNDGRTTEILAFLPFDRFEDAPAVAAAISKATGMPIRSKGSDSDASEGTVTPWTQDGMMALFMAERSVMDYILNLIIVFITAITIFNTMFVSVMERFGEFGILKALGMRDGANMRLVLLEGFIIGVVGAVCGIVLFLGPAWYLQKYGLDISGQMEGFNMPAMRVMRARITPFALLSAAATGAVSSVLASILPALRARKMEPVEALRRVRV